MFRVRLIGVAVGFLLIGAIVLPTAPKAATIVYVCGDSRSNGFQDDLAGDLKGIATVKYISAEEVKNVGDAAGSMKDATLIYFSGGMDDVTCLAGPKDPAMTPAVQKRLASYLSALRSAISKMKTSAPKAKLVYHTILGCGPCSQFGAKGYNRGDYNDLCDGTMCRRRRVDVITFNNASVPVAKELGVTVHDLFTFTKDYPFREGPDGRHFNAPEQAKMADEVARFIKPFLTTAISQKAGKQFARSALPLTIRHSAGSLLVKNTTSQTVKVSVKDLCGRMLSSLTLHGNEERSIPYSQLSAGTVVLSEGSTGICVREVLSAR